MLPLAVEDIQKLQDNIRLFKQNISPGLNHHLISSDSSIQCLVAGSNEKARHVANVSQNAGLDVRPILSPTVAKGTERLRICLHSFNTNNEIVLLTNTINQLIND